MKSKVKVVIPAAGEGRRLKPHTHTTPKPLLSVAGKPIIGHIMERVKELNPEEVIIIIAPNGNPIEKYLKENYPLKFQFVIQEEPKGLGDAVYKAKPYFKNEPCLIILGDTIIDMPLVNLLGEENWIGVKKVEDPKRFGIVEIKDGSITKIVEKPAEPKSDLAIVGVYYIFNSFPLFNALEKIIKENIKTKGEYQLSDALELMIEEDINFRPYPVEYWLDCGTPEALIQTNRYLLQNTHYFKPRENALIIPPVYIHDTAIIENSIIGPFVSISEEVEIRNSIIRDSIINQGSYIEHSLLEDSILGENSIVKEKPLRLNLGSFSIFEAS
ncbi:MAG: sugar phosphate nucleotidyltransferase [candidate division WOR-3 bacterium]